MPSMEGVITKLADVTYDFVGVLLPGIALLFIGVFQWQFHLVALQGPVPWNSVESSLLAVLVFLEGHGWATLLGGLGAAYLAGRMALFLARNGLPVWNDARAWIGRQVKWLDPPKASWPKLGRLVHRVLLWRAPKYGLRELSPELKPWFDHCSRRIQVPSVTGDAPVNWRGFQLVATRVLQQGETKTRYQIHQYKYTLDRSLATVFSLGLWSSVPLLATHFSEWRFLLLEAGAFLFMAFVFDDEHAFHWGLWADVLVADSFAAGVGSKNEH